MNKTTGFDIRRPKTYAKLNDADRRVYDDLVNKMQCLHSDREKLEYVKTFADKFNGSEMRVYKPNDSEFHSAQALFHALVELYGYLCIKNGVDLSDNHRQDAIDHCGSQPDQMPLERMLCCRFDARSYCLNPAKFTCSKCGLHAYCSKECQVAQWSVHKDECKRACSYVPFFESQHRDPVISDAVHTRKPNHIDYLWGDMPAVDVVGRRHGDGDVQNVLFVKCSDCRDVIKTINNLSVEDADREINVYLNDPCPLVIARALLLLTALTREINPSYNIDACISMMYSMQMTLFQSHTMTAAALEVMVDAKVLPAIMNRNGAKIVMDVSTIRSYNILKDMARSAPQCSVEYVQRNFDQLFNHDTIRLDKRDLVNIHESPPRRHAHRVYINDGLFLPYGANSINFNVGNPFILDPVDGLTMPDCSDILSCFEYDEMHASGVRANCPRNDMYGAAYFHIHEQITRFVQQLKSLNITFHVSCRDYNELPDWYTSSCTSFDRIYMSNIGDDSRTAWTRTLTSYGALLSSNTDSCMITLFKNWINFKLIWDSPMSIKSYPTEMMTNLNNYKSQQVDVVTEELVQAGASGSQLMYGPIVYPYARDYNVWPLFNHYLGRDGVLQSAVHAGLEMRELNVIVGRRLGVDVGDDNDKCPEKLYSCASSNYTEMYVEWVRRQ